MITLCLVYVLSGFIGRSPWGNADITAFGYMLELAYPSHANLDLWLQPSAFGLAPESPALLPYWLGAWAIALGEGFLRPDVAVQLPFMGLLALTLCTTWYAVYQLARSPQAQPVAFAFGGEANPIDYARAVADGGMLALLACLGLALLSHETTPASAQLCFVSLCYYGFSALAYRSVLPVAALGFGMVGLALSGAPTLAALLAVGGCAACARSSAWALPRNRLFSLSAAAAMSLLACALSWWLDLWRWQLTLPPATWLEARRFARLLLWFTWPAWPLALWTLWRWRHLLSARAMPLHLTLPLWFAACCTVTALLSAGSDRSLLLALPALASLAAFALPTLKRSMSALIDWFTLLFFSGCALCIWVVWIAMQTGIPRAPAANVAKLAPGFEPGFSLATFCAAVLATLAWSWLVRWRIRRNPAVIWKSLVLPASGAVLSWFLLMSLWLPLLDYARSYKVFVSRVTRETNDSPCLQVLGLTRAQMTALRYHGNIQLTEAGRTQNTCTWLLVSASSLTAQDPQVDLSSWRMHWQSKPRKATANKDDVILLKK
ncbi:MAG: hypothetical protein ACKVOO_02735 [Burkholderiaceae bacterium]